jgi:transcriptional regulator with XRE-family HTH domain
MTNKTHPERLRAVRKDMGLTLAQMAVALGFSQASHVAALEAGRATFTPMLTRLIDAYEAGYRPGMRVVRMVEA